MYHHHDMAGVGGSGSRHPDSLMARSSGFRRAEVGEFHVTDHYHWQCPWHPRYVDPGPARTSDELLSSSRKSRGAGEVQMAGHPSRADYPRNKAARKELTSEGASAVGLSQVVFSRRRPEHGSFSTITAHGTEGTHGSCHMDRGVSHSASMCPETNASEHFAVRETTWPCCLPAARLFCVSPQLGLPRC